MRKRKKSRGRKAEPWFLLNTKDIQLRKFQVAFSILAIGMMVAVVWYGFQWLMGNGYPYNTYLFLPAVRFSDFTNTLSNAGQPNPYMARDNPYPPVAYLLLRPLVGVPMNLQIFLLSGIVPTFFLLFYVMRPVLREFSESILKQWTWAQRIQSANWARYFIDKILGSVWTLLLLIFCEPFVSCIDRGNIELWVIFTVAMSLYYFSKARFYACVAWLVLPICLKVYPCVLLALFLRRGGLRFIVLTLVAVVAVSSYSYSCFGDGALSNFELNVQQVELNANVYITGNMGLSETASPWNLYRAMAITNNAIQTGTFFDPRWNWYPLIPQFRDDLKTYTNWMAVVAVLITFYSVFVEKEVLRRMVVLLLYMVLASPSGAEHKITHIGTALVALIMVRSYRRGDFLATALLAFTLIPKKEYMFECFGPTDSGANDVSCAIVFNPLAMLTALGVLCWYGASNFDSKWCGLRFRGLLASLRLLKNRRVPQSI